MAVASRARERFEPSKRDMQRLADYVQGFLYLEKHRKRLVKQHPDQWVAVHRDKVVAAEPTLDELHRALKARKVDSLACFKKLLTKKKVTYILGEQPLAGSTTCRECWTGCATETIQ